MKFDDLINIFRETFKVSRFDIIKKLSILLEKDISFIISNKIEIEDIKIDKLYKHYNYNYPIEYLSNYVHFLGRKFYINNNVLIPRNETEDLVLHAIDIIKKNRIVNVVDIGTGSGIIAISLKKECPFINVYATDICKNALNVAEKNADTHNTDIKFFIGDNLNPVLGFINKIDLIISNPPYVEDSYIVKNNSLKYEPQIAVFSGKDGMDFFNNFVLYKKYLNNKHILFESSEFSVDKTADLLEEIGKIEILKDLENKNRFIYTYVSLFE